MNTVNPVNPVKPVNLVEPVEPVDPVDYDERLFQIAETNPDVVVMTAENRAAIRSLSERLGSRFIDVGIAEQTLVGAAAGLALRGRVPIVHALATFLTMRAFEFIRTDVGIAQLPVKLVGALAGFLSEANGPTHQALEDLALMRGIPGMNVCCPADQAEMLEAIAIMVGDRAPWYMRYNTRQPAFRHRTPFVTGTAEVVTEGTDVALLTYGCLTCECYEAAGRLADAGIGVRLLNMRTLKPIDEAAILRAARETGLVVTVEDHFAIGGLATIVAEVAASNHVAVQLHPIALNGRWFTPALFADVLECEGFSGEHLARRISAALATNAPKREVMSHEVMSMPKVAQVERSLPVITRSDEWYARATGLIPAYTQTLAKGPGQYVAGVAPKYLQRGKGSHVWDVDGNEFIDLSMAIGPLSLGYGYEAVDRAIREQLEEGITFSMMHPLEVEVAELIRDAVPNAEMVRYSKTGAEVTSAAVRLARAFTRRSKVICCGYHGWHDWYISVTDRSLGVPKTVQDLTLTFDYNDMASVTAALDGDTACAILEPMIFDEPRDGFLHELKAACRRNGTLLIFDEMWTGFRFALGGAQERFGVQADLMCYSKAVANGMPLAVLAGRADVMRLCEKDVFFFTTFGGEALSLAAAKATIGELRDRRVPAYLERQGRVLRDGYNELARDLGMPYTRAIGAGCRSLVTFDPGAGDPLEMKSLVQQELIARGILWSGFHNMSFSHTDADVALTLTAYREALMVLKLAVDAGSVRQALLGSPVEPVFRRTSNANR